MKTLFTILILILLNLSEGFSNFEGWQLVGEIPTGDRPASVFTVRDEVFLVVCAGWDANHNGIQEIGDESPSIWYFYANSKMISMFPSWADFTLPQKLIDLDFRDEILPMRPALFEEEMEIYLPGPNGVTKVKFEIEDYNPIKMKASKENILPIIPKSISKGIGTNGNNRLYLSMRDQINNTGNVIFYDLITKTFYDTIPAYENVQMTAINKSNTEMYILNSDSSSGNSTLQVVHIGGVLGTGKHLLLKEADIPTDANYISANGNVYITSVKNSNITIMNNNYSIKTQALNFPLNEGAREFLDVQTGNHSWTSSYNGNVYYTNFNDGTHLDSLNAYGRAEGMAKNMLFFAIATPYKEGTFQPDSAITLYGIEVISVDEEENINYGISPNPASGYIEISLNNETSLNASEVQIFNILGIEMMSVGRGLDLSTQRIDVSGLPSGIYYIKIGDIVEKFVKI
jgi:hypothetical protein